MKTFETIKRDENLRQLQRDFLIKCTIAAEAAMTRDDPAEMRHLAEVLADFSLNIKQRLGSLQGRLNSKAFGRK